MGIALFTLTAAQRPLQGLKRLFVYSLGTCRQPNTRAAHETLTVRAGPLTTTDPHSTSPELLQQRLKAEHQRQRPLRGNWPFTAKPPAKAPEAPAKTPANSGVNTCLPTRMAGSRRQALLASLGGDTRIVRAPTKVLRRVSDTHTGRLVIAGRMADVCAELDRMVALEALRA